MKTLSIQNFINLLTSEAFDFSYPTSATSLQASIQIEDFKLEFVIDYEVTAEGYSSATITNPEEAVFKFENKDHSEIELSKAGEFIELEKNELEEIDEIIALALY